MTALFFAALAVGVFLEIVAPILRGGLSHALGSNEPIVLDRQIERREP